MPYWVPRYLARHVIQSDFAKGQMSKYQFRISYLYDLSLTSDTIYFVKLVSPWMNHIFRYSLHRSVKKFSYSTSKNTIWINVRIQEKYAMTFTLKLVAYIKTNLAFLKFLIISMFVNSALLYFWVKKNASSKLD